MKRVEQLVTRVREETENEEFGETYGISDNEIINYLNDGQFRVYSEIVKTHRKFFLSEEILTPTVNVESLSLPTKLYLGKISLLEYSTTGQTKDYYRLKQATMPERLSYPSGNPEYYIRRNREILFVPVPNIQNGTVRLTYVKRIPRLDKRRAKVAAVTLDTGNLQISALSFDTSSDIDRTNLLEENYMCIVDKDGDLKMAGIPLTDIDTSTGVVTFDTSFVYQSGESIAVGDYAVMGEYTANRSQLHEETERYLLYHAKMETINHDSDTPGTAVESEKMRAALSEVVEAYADDTDDIYEVPLLDPSYYTE